MRISFLILISTLFLIGVISAQEPLSSQKPTSSDDPIPSVDPLTSPPPSSHETSELQHEYVGVDRCKMCHKGEKNGNIFETWQVGFHAMAYEVLATERAVEVYKIMGMDGSPQTAPLCLKCHVTGYSENTISTSSTSSTSETKMENGVTCESCHGAGGGYWKKQIMMDRELAIQKGLVANPKTACVKCHNEASPTHKPFKFEERWPLIQHGKPKTSTSE